MAAWNKMIAPAPGSGPITWARTDAPGDNTNTVADRGKSGPNPVSPAG